ncbi:MAG: nitroreductase family protein, partial [Candidatus Aenigmarchaeota archaeon]|nr:nitroreductase family protein [Candidatus Aenigmarchaeota archaeon]
AYRVLSGTSKRDELRKNKIFKQDFVYKAPVIIVCCADPTAYPHAKLEPGYDDSYESRAARDLSISSQNIVLRATELGLGTCYIGWMEHERIKTVLGIPDKYIVPFVITVGHPDEKPKATARKRISDIVL